MQRRLLQRHAHREAQAAPTCASVASMDMNARSARNGTNLRKLNIVLTLAVERSKCRCWPARSH